ncbi:MAG: toprim domain-containing protein [Anaerolineae bacterium]|nr:toprim domain-containing protein [Anaerolineae bacterium]
MKYDHEALEKKYKRRLVGADMPPLDKNLWDTMKTYLDGRDLDFDLAKDNGWYPSHNAGDNFQRIVMPAVNKSGRAYWQARDISGKSTKRYQSPSVPRGDSIIQTWPMKKMTYKSFVVVEGPMCALAAAQMGLPGIALMGCQPTEDTFNYIVNVLEGLSEYCFVVQDRDATQEAIVLVQALAAAGAPAVLIDPYPYKDLAAVPSDRRPLFFKPHIEMRKLRAIELTH